MSKTIALAGRLNQECECVGTDVPALQHRLDSKLVDAGHKAGVAETHPHLYSELPVFIAHEHVSEMQRVVAAVGRVTRLPAYRDAVLGNAPAIARVAPAALGVFFGFDFHLGAAGARLIEINTNAGGALLNVEMRRAQQACCAPATEYLKLAPSAESIESAIFEMFIREWRLARGSRPLATIAIVDDAPREQFLLPEFLLFQRLFEARGVRAVIADAREFSIRGGALVYTDQRIDLVYNRSTDFYFDDPAHAALAEAYAHDLAVITPHPHAHALYSNKANLVTLSDAAALQTLGVEPLEIETLARAIPRTLRVDGPEERWWADRKRWFFKPVHGFGSRGTYRGDKITRRAFADVMRGGYIAQEIAPPSERRDPASADESCFKFDIRSYVYDGVSQLFAARLYQGQTTNFRSAGGGFAPVYVLRDGIGGTAKFADSLASEGMCSPS